MRFLLLLLFIVPCANAQRAAHGLIGTWDVTVTPTEDDANCTSEFQPGLSQRWNLQVEPTGAVFVEVSGEGSSQYPRMFGEYSTLGEHLTISAGGTQTGAPLLWMRLKPRLGVRMEGFARSLYNELIPATRTTPQRFKPCFIGYSVSAIKRP